MKILVTGAAGFIGFYLSKRLLEAGETVIGLDNMNDYFAVSDLVRRMKTIEAMNTVIKYANNEDIAMGCWLYEVDDGSKGLDFYDYVDDETYFSVVKLFIDIIKEDVKDVNDLAY